MARSNARVTVAAAGTPVQLSGTSVLCSEVFVQAERDNTGNICVGWSNAVRAAAGSQNGVHLAAGEGVTIGDGKVFHPQLDLSALWIDSSVNGDGVSIFYM